MADPACYVLHGRSGFEVNTSIEGSIDLSLLQRSTNEPERQRKYFHRGKGYANDFVATDSSVISLTVADVDLFSPLGWGYSQNNLIGVCGPLPKTPTLFYKTKIYDFSYPIYDLTKNLIP